MTLFKIKSILPVLVLILITGSSCSSKSVNNDNGKEPPVDGDTTNTTNEGPTYYEADKFVMGADLSYVNQILDHGGTYQDSGSVESPYKIFSRHGANVVRVRLWHDPEWVRTEVYNDANAPLYSGLADVTETIRKAKEQGMEVNLDLHFSDTWADPSTQEVPKAWKDISSLEVLKDSLYNYTKQTLQHLESLGLMPEMVQIGNETNCGMMYSNASSGFPKLNVCEGENWQNLGAVINSGIKAVREVSANSEVDTKVILHVAQPENVEWWFNNITAGGGVSDFDIIGFSYYAPWSDVPLNKMADNVSSFRQAFNKQVMIVETAYSWTTQNADSYNNIFGPDSQESGYPISKDGQLKYMTDLVQQVINGGGKGVFYWEPAWITSNMKDKWGTGSAWENNALFDFEGNLHKGIDYMTHSYEFN